MSHEFVAAFSGSAHRLASVTAEDRLRRQQWHTPGVGQLLGLKKLQDTHFHHAEEEMRNAFRRLLRGHRRPSGQQFTREEAINERRL